MTIKLHYLPVFQETKYGVQNYQLIPYKINQTYQYGHIQILPQINYRQHSKLIIDSIINIITYYQMQLINYFVKQLHNQSTKQTLNSLSLMCTHTKIQQTIMLHIADIVNSFVCGLSYSFNKRKNKIFFQKQFIAAKEHTISILVCMYSIFPLHYDNQITLKSTNSSLVKRPRYIILQCILLSLKTLDVIPKKIRTADFNKKYNGRYNYNWYRQYVPQNDSYCNTYAKFIWVVVLFENTK
eukprot:TRINITY_DN5964_c0_g1_i2.p1 TRINITY_DN5964_c0_g1~~TRINITY_DN5964_c0_g1_i2.p1  ORF type:complete len:240 (-),score=-22.87 TRINITY_DN5964_c0_g1_i2:1035-1754(-)